MTYCWFEITAAMLPQSCALPQSRALRNTAHTPLVTRLAAVFKPVAAVNKHNICNICDCVCVYISYAEY